jgi:hypothetical protein
MSYLRLPDGTWRWRVVFRQAIGVVPVGHDGREQQAQLEEHSYKMDELDRGKNVYSATRFSGCDGALHRKLTIIYFDQKKILFF